VKIPTGGEALEQGQARDLYRLFGDAAADQVMNPEPTVKVWMEGNGRSFVIACAPPLRGFFFFRTVA
jgi:hypothetical protein